MFGDDACASVEMKVEILPIDSIAEVYGGTRWQAMADSDKEFCELHNVETWSESGWTPSYRVIRHALPFHKRIIRIVTHKGLVDVTDDHSLLRDDGSEVSPKDVLVGDALLHRPLAKHESGQGQDANDYFNNVSITDEETEAMVMGFFFGDGSCGTYRCAKYTCQRRATHWALNNADSQMISKYKQLCQRVLSRV